MNKFNTKLSAAIAMAAVIATTLAPAAMADTVDISQNGANSTNNVTVTKTGNTTVNQSNATLVVNGVLAGSNTGDNNANKNNGGSTSITSGNATTDVAITNNDSLNDATLPACGCPNPTANVTVEKNSAYSNNTVRVTDNSNLTVNQENRGAVINLVGARSRTGGNRASLNNGGNTSVRTGNALTNIRIRNTGPANILR